MNSHRLIHLDALKMTTCLVIFLSYKVKILFLREKQWLKKRKYWTKVGYSMISINIKWQITLSFGQHNLIQEIFQNQNYRTNSCNLLSTQAPCKKRAISSSLGNKKTIGNKYFIIKKAICFPVNKSPSPSCLIYLVAECNSCQGTQPSCPRDTTWTVSGCYSRMTDRWKLSSVRADKV